jgi:hypothetical protein
MKLRICFLLAKHARFLQQRSEKVYSMRLSNLFGDVEHDHELLEVVMLGQCYKTFVSVILRYGYYSKIS